MSALIEFKGFNKFFGEQQVLNEHRPASEVRRSDRHPRPQRLR